MHMRQFNTPILIASAWFLLTHPASAQRPLVVLEGEAASVAVHLAGGSIVEFRLKSNPLNPLQWEEPGAPDAARPRGHFLCLDRWGAPSEAERREGMPFHGEAARVTWKVGPPAVQSGTVAARVTASLPLAGLEVNRSMRLSMNGACLAVQEEVINRNKLGRPYNLVQHPTIGPPFLTEDTIVDSNAQQGLMQDTPGPDPERSPVFWPYGRSGDDVVDLRRLSNDARPNVVSFTVEEEYGWVTAATPSRRLLIGYLWKTAEYPWLNIWRHVEQGRPFARGLEFGTTGLHQPFPVLLSKGRIFWRPLFAYLDTGESTKRSYLAFLAAIPGDWQGTAQVGISEAGLTILESRATGRSLTVGLPAGQAPW